jgi:hypothetical protein
MKIVFRTVLFHFVCILVFALLYSTFAQDFGSLDDDLYSENNNRTKEKRTFLDFLLLSTTIQAGVGISEFFPSSSFTKIILIIQQLIMISTHVFTLYFFTL